MESALAYAQSGPRAIVESSPDPFAALGSELSDLSSSLSLPPIIVPRMSTRALRDAVVARGTAVSHEVRRFVVVLLTAAESPSRVLDGASARALAGSVADAVALFVGAAQALIAVASTNSTQSPLVTGTVFVADVRAAASGLLAHVADLVRVARKASRRTAAADDGTYTVGEGAERELLPEAGKVGAWVDSTVSRLPVSPASAIRRALLSARLILRRSAEDLREETAGATGSSSHFVDAAAAAFKAAAALIAAVTDVSDAAGTADDAERDAAAAADGSAPPAAQSSPGNAEQTTRVVADDFAVQARAIGDAVIDMAAAASDVCGDGENATDDFDDGEEGAAEDDDEEEEGGGGGGDSGAREDARRALNAGAAATADAARKLAGVAAAVTAELRTRGVLGASDLAAAVDAASAAAIDACSKIETLSL